MYVVNKAIDELQIESSHTRANTREIERIFDVLDTKANTSFLNTELDIRPTTDAVQTMLAPKANRSEVDNQLSRKADCGDIQHIHAALECKTDVAVTESMARELDTKGNHDEILNILDNELAQKADNTEVQNLAADLDKTRVDLAQEI